MAIFHGYVEQPDGIYIKAVWNYRAPSPTARRLCATQRVATLDGNLGYRHMCTEIQFFFF